jgi:hypothetical protein
VPRVAGQMGVFGGGEDGVVTEDFLHLQQIDPRLDQMGRVAVTQAVRGDLFFNPHCCATLRKVSCTPPRSSGVVARCAPFRPAWRLGNSSLG